MLGDYTHWEVLARFGSGITRRVYAAGVSDAGLDALEWPWLEALRRRRDLTWPAAAQ